MTQPIYDPDVKTVKVRRAAPDEPNRARNIRAKAAAAALVVAAGIALSACHGSCPLYPVHP